MPLTEVETAKLAQAEDIARKLLAEDLDVVQKSQQRRRLNHFKDVLSRVLGRQDTN
jgi:hypothetical protein